MKDKEERCTQASQGVASLPIFCPLIAELTQASPFIFIFKNKKGMRSEASLLRQRAPPLLRLFFFHTRASAHLPSAPLHVYTAACLFFLFLYIKIKKKRSDHSYAVKFGRLRSLIEARSKQRCLLRTAGRRGDSKFNNARGLPTPSLLH